MTDKKMTIKETCEAIRALGLTVGYSRDYKEFRMNIPRNQGGTESTACYTQFRDDALATARDMARRMAVKQT